MSSFVHIYTLDSKASAHYILVLNCKGNVDTASLGVYTGLHESGAGEYLSQKNDRGYGRAHLTRRFSEVVSMLLM